MRPSALKSIFSCLILYVGAKNKFKKKEYTQMSSK